MRPCRLRLTAIARVLGVRGKTCDGGGVVPYPPDGVGRSGWLVLADRQIAVTSRHDHEWGLIHRPVLALNVTKLS